MSCNNKMLYEGTVAQYSIRWYIKTTPQVFQLFTGEVNVASKMHVFNEIHHHNKYFYGDCYKFIAVNHLLSEHVPKLLFVESSRHSPV